MKTHDNLRPAIGNASWVPRGRLVLAALLAALVAGIGLASLPLPAAQAPASQAPAASAGASIGTVKSPYDGSAYVEYLTPRTPLEAAAAGAPNPNLPAIGAGSAYDGGAYAEYLDLARRFPSGLAPAVAPNPNLPAIGTGSAYDGGAYVEYLTPRSPIEAAPEVAPRHEDNSSYSGSAYAEYIEYITGRPFPGSEPRSAFNPNVPISGTGSAYDGGASAR
jgi:hypothetical protein